MFAWQYDCEDVLLEYQHLEKDQYCHPEHRHPFLFTIFLVAVRDTYYMAGMDLISFASHWVANIYEAEVLTTVQTLSTWHLVVRWFRPHLAHLCFSRLCDKTWPKTLNNGDCRVLRDDEIIPDLHTVGVYHRILTTDLVGGTQSITTL